MSDHTPRTLVAASIADQLYDILCERIVTGRYKPGQRLDVQAIAKEFGVSKTPVRDALLELEAGNLIETRPRSGTFVATLSIKDVHEVCQLRKGIESVATSLAATRIDHSVIVELRREVLAARDAAADGGNFEAFFASDTNLHQSIVRASDNARLAQVRHSVQPFVDWLQFLGATGLDRVLGSTRRHLEILDALEARNAEAAGRTAALHLDEVEQWTTDDLERLGYA